MDIQSKAFKTGLNGYDKRDVDSFMHEVRESYERLYREHKELRLKTEALNSALTQYKSIEKSLQKALVLAQKASEDVKEQAQAQAKLIEEEAHNRAKIIVEEANSELERIHTKTIAMLHQFDMYKAQYKQLINTQLDMLASESFNMELSNLKESTEKKEAPQLFDLKEDNSKEDAKKAKKIKKELEENILESFEEEEEEDEEIETFDLTGQLPMIDFEEAEELVTEKETKEMKKEHSEKVKKDVTSESNGRKRPQKKAKKAAIKETSIEDEYVSMITEAFSDK